MHLSKITLNNFRNCLRRDFNLNEFLTIIVGENAKGKTNLLESIFFLINGNGFRESREEELINFEQEHAFVEGIFGENSSKFNFRISLIRKGESVEKTYFVNKTKKRHLQYSQEQIKAILFTPEQIEIMTGAPDNRREYLNQQLSFYDVEYKRKLVNYENALRKRNKILNSVIGDMRLKEELVFWDEYLESQAVYITKKREEYIYFLNNHRLIDSREFEIEYLKNELTVKRLQEKFDQEKYLRKTSIGPQKDDICIYQLDKKFKKDLHHFGSRSEQRLAIFWLKINEINYYEMVRKKEPLLLLDDVFSELDKKNKKLVLNLIEKYQTVITTTESDLIDQTKISKNIIEL